MTKVDWHCYNISLKPISHTSRKFTISAETTGYYNVDIECRLPITGMNNEDIECRLPIIAMTNDVSAHPD